jgi:hypothetical protein
MLVAAPAAKGKGLNPSLRKREAVDLFHVLTRPELYYALTAGRGWSAARTRKWLTELLADQMLGAR